MRVTVSAREQKARRLSTSHLEQAVGAFRRDGYVVIENAISADEVQVLLETTYACEEHYRKTEELPVPRCHHSSTRDDYFRIDEEQRTRLVDGVWIGGRINTFPEPGSTLLEPWRRDSAAGFEKLYATLQSVRRHANIQVTPDQQGMLINVVVYKELETLDRPEHATVGTSTRRHDGTLTNDRFDVDVPFTDPDFAGWIALGRDAQLEARIIEQIHGRIFAR